MKTKFSRILGVGLSLALLTSLFVMATPASADTLTWGAETSLDDLKANLDYILAPTGADVLDLAVNGNTMYAVTGTTTSDNATFKSTDGGMTWSSLVSSTDYPTAGAPVLVAVAPDNADVVAIVTNEREVYVSTNGGGKWSDLDLPTGDAAVNAIDVSSGTDRHVAVGGRTTGGAAELWTIKLAMASTWKTRVATTTTNFATGQTDVMAVKFSPNASTDETITIISGNSSAAASGAIFQVFRYTEGQESWNDGIARPGMTDYFNGILIDTMTNGLGAADIALVPTYLATEETERIAFVAVSDNTADAGGVRRLVDAAKSEEFDQWNDGDPGAVSTLALHPDSGKLLGGKYDNNLVYTWLAPLSGTTPNAERPNSLKPPSGATKTVVAWSGDNAVAATSGDESALAISADDGYAWNDVSLIDTELDTIVDVAVNADASKVYLSSFQDTDDASVWLKETSWKRVLSKPDQTANQAAFLIRIAPDDAAAVYVSANGTTDMWVSKNSGMTSWKNIPAYKITLIQDFAVLSADVVYAIDTAGATKTTNAGASWEDKQGLDGVPGYMISLAPNGDVLVGSSTGGKVAFSKDGGATFTATKAFTISATGSIQVIADKDYATNNTIYVARGDEVFRGQASDTYTTALARGPTLPSDHTIIGMARLDNIVYFLSSNASSSRLYRALNLLAADTGDLALWSFRQTTDDYHATPQALRMSSTYTDRGAKGPNFWAIDTSADKLRRILDPIATAGPTLTSPADKATIPINRESGLSYDVSFSWARYSSKYLVSMDVQIAVDDKFNAKIVDTTVKNLDSDGVAQVFGPGMSGSNAASFMPGTTYYWRTRHSKEIDSSTQTDTNANFSSPWSATRSFKIEAPVTFGITSPVVGAEGVSIEPTFVWTPYEGAISYEVAVSELADFSILEWIHNTNTTYYKATEADALANDTTYYWRVRGVTGPPAVVRGQPQPAPGGLWATGIFTTAAKAVAPTPTVIVEKEPAPPAEVKVIEVPVPAPAAPIPSYLLWTIIVIGAVLIIALIVLIVRTRRVA